LGKAISIKEYIWLKLFGAYEIDHSIASATGLFDVLQLEWFAPSLAFCGVTQNQLSTPVPTTFIRTDLQPSVATLLQLPAGTPVCIGSSDGCLANVGSDALEAGTAAVTIGTSGALRIASPQPVVVFPDMIFNYRLDANTFICGGAINNGGAVVQWLLQKFLDQATPDAAAYAQLFDRAAIVPAGSDGLLCLPYLTGERTPLWDEKTCGVYFGFHAQHGNAHFIRAALEGVSFALQDILKKLEAATGAIQTLQVSGGMVHSDMWMQLLADVTGKNVRLLFSEDASAVGAARLCYKVMDITKSYAAAGESIQKEITPDQRHHAVYKTSFPLFQALYTTLKPAMHQLYTTSG
jgi:gluconokinase